MKILFYNLILAWVCLFFSCSNHKEEKITLYKISEMAKKMYEERQYADAYALYNILIKADSLNPELYFKRAYCSAALGFYDDAREDYFKCIDLNYKTDRVNYNIALTYIATNDTLAKTYLKKTLEINPYDQKSRNILKRLNKLKKGEELILALNDSLIAQ